MHYNYMLCRVYIFIQHLTFFFPRACSMFFPVVFRDDFSFGAPIYISSFSEYIPLLVSVSLLRFVLAAFGIHTDGGLWICRESFLHCDHGAKNVCVRAIAGRFDITDWISAFGERYQ